MIGKKLVLDLLHERIEAAKARNDDRDECFIDVGIGFTVNEAIAIYEELKSND